MKLNIRNETLRLKPIWPGEGEELATSLIEFQLADRISRAESRARAEAYSRRQAKSRRRAVRQGRHDGQNAPMLGQITPPGAEFRAVLHDKRLA